MLAYSYFKVNFNKTSLVINAYCYACDEIRKLYTDTSFSKRQYNNAKQLVKGVTLPKQQQQQQKHRKNEQIDKDLQSNGNWEKHTSIYTTFV